MATEDNSSSSSPQPQGDEKKIGRWVSTSLELHRRSCYETPAKRVSPQNNYYAIPHHVRNGVRMNKIPDVLLTGLSVETYADYFSTLLHLEDLHIKDMSRYIIPIVNIQIVDTKWALLKLPREREKDFLPLLGDFIEVIPSNGNGNRYCKGCVGDVEEDTICVEFEQPLHKFYNPNLEYKVRCDFARHVNIKRCQFAAIAEAAGVLSKSFLFPSQSSIPMRIKKLRECVAPFNKSLSQQQLTAVIQILKCCGSPPYIIYGERGTGTSRTITEAILQIHARNPNARILACTPFNLFSDMLMYTLIGSIDHTEMLRLNAVFRRYDEVLTEILPYCLYENNIFSCPPLKELMDYKVIISTYMSADRLHTEGVPRGHFTHIFLDLAGSGSEPETMVALAKFATISTVVVVAGDPEKLAHSIRSPMAQMYGLGKSYLQRLTKLPLYNTENQYSKEKKMFVTKLEKEYEPDSEIWEILY